MSTHIRILVKNFKYSSATEKYKMSSTVSKHSGHHYMASQLRRPWLEKDMV